MKLRVLYLVVCLCVWVESQDLLPAPTLNFSSSVNRSAITRYSSIHVVCTIPENVSLPVDVYLSLAEKAANSPLRSSIFQSQRQVEFSLDARPDYETTFVCWYQNFYSKVQSQFSNGLDVVVSALPDPKLFIFPPVFPVGMNYSVQCEVSQLNYKNVTIHMYNRLLPISPGKEVFQYIGFRFLLPGDTGAVVYRTNARETYEYMCEEEVFQKGRTLLSRTTITAMPEELPVRLVPTDPSLGSCIGYAFLKVKDDWRPLCFAPSFYDSLTVAHVICRDLGCGSAVESESLAVSAPDAIGTPNCIGKEKKLAECPILVKSGCGRGTLNIACSATLLPPKLSLLEYNALSRVYVRTDESVTLQCVFESPVKEANIIFTQNGNVRYSTRARSGLKETWVLPETVPEGEYACFVRAREGGYKTESSNVIGIYIYDPPPAGVVAGGVITTIVGVIILVLLCIYGSSS
ncbi:hypothetical protein Baya_13617 [Bagarius yarrelli]|uniref:Uncharacterized protein n=1 Tax=Bagarius yarrelli TaxID=175774 RepID=A0A556V6H5_BAGYA|nr:hypothetical protein Baya_13617 [Bagarius yarrelli]